MPGPKKTKSDPHFMPNLEKAIKEEARRQGRGLPPPPGRLTGEEDAPSAAPPDADLVGAGPPSRPSARGPREATAIPLDRETLLKELRGLLGKLDAEGLSFLLEQARVHLHNMEVERRNAALAEVPAGGGGGSRGKAKGRAAKKGVFSLERSSSGSSYYLSSGGDSAMFSAEEMLALVRISFGNAESVEAGRALGAWLRRERGDALDSLGLRATDSLGLGELAAFLRRNFRDPGAKGRG